MNELILKNMTDEGVWTATGETDYDSIIDRIAEHGFGMSVMPAEPELQRLRVNLFSKYEKS